MVKLRNAERHVAAGRAKWTSKTSIRFIESNPARQAAEMRAAESAIGYDRRGVLTVKEMRAVPIVNPMAMLTIQRKRAAHA